MRKQHYPAVAEIHRGWAARVREQRIQRGWTLEKFAEMIDADPSTISRWETGRTVIPDEAKIRLAGMLGMHPCELFPWPALRPPMPRPRPARKATAA